MSVSACFRIRISTRTRGDSGTLRSSTTTPITTFDKSSFGRIGLECPAVLPRRPESHQAAGRSRKPQMVGAQLERGRSVFRWDRVFNWQGEKNEASVFYQALHVSRPGSLDTSLVSTDNIKTRGR